MNESGSRHRVIRTLLRAAITLGVGLALALPAATVRAECRRPTDGIGGTGQQPRPRPTPQPSDDGKDGVGGTGHSAPRPVEKTAAARSGDGIGGTGIVGIVTGFGSYFYEADAMLEETPQRASGDDE